MPVTCGNGYARTRRAQHLSALACNTVHFCAISNENVQYRYPYPSGTRAGAGSGIMTDTRYVHGYSERENERLSDQAQALTALLHDDTRYPAGSRVLEAGCGIGAQTVILAKNSPDAVITSVDISPESVRRAESRARRKGSPMSCSGPGTSAASRFHPEVLTTSSYVSCSNTLPIRSGRSGSSARS